ncbi:MAG: hypothetical protein ACE5GK_03125 [Nitrospiria bacterium]
MIYRWMKFGMMKFGMPASEMMGMTGKGESQALTCFGPPVRRKAYPGHEGRKNKDIYHEAILQ